MIDYYNASLIDPVLASTFTAQQIALAQYNYIVSSVSFFFALVISYFVFRFLVWFLPSFWYKNDTRSSK